MVLGLFSVQILEGDLSVNLEETLCNRSTLERAVGLVGGASAPVMRPNAPLLMSPRRRSKVYVIEDVLALAPICKVRPSVFTSFLRRLMSVFTSCGRRSSCAANLRNLPGMSKHRIASRRAACIHARVRIASGWIRNAGSRDTRREVRHQVVPRLWKAEGVAPLKRVYGSPPR